ncbi:MAG: 16S rRNA (uracil(1498)-N(3))-methyltransferase [Oscillospiraceae bacterium]|nr:16S rRNA (uracil(1498)-N(3))-methyltransferase [Oscillospiraceae bacterium]
MYRFFVQPSDVLGETITLSSGDSEHIRSLRLRPSELFVVCDGNGTDYICRLAEKPKPQESSGSRKRADGGINQARSGRSEAPVSNRKSRAGNEPGDTAAPGRRDRATTATEALIVASSPTRGEPAVDCAMFIAYAKGDRLDYAVQKTVELGAHSIRLFPCARSIAVPEDSGNRIARMQKIAAEAAKQCGRGRIPVVSAACSFEDAVSDASQAILPLFLYESEEELTLRSALESRSGAATVSIFTGPEGGFEEEEAQLARRLGMLSVTLGPRVLRCETAPVAALSAIMYHYGNL